MSTKSKKKAAKSSSGIRKVSKSTEKKLASNEIDDMFTAASQKKAEAEAELSAGSKKKKRKKGKKGDDGSDVEEDDFLNEETMEFYSDDDEGDEITKGGINDEGWGMIKSSGGSKGNLPSKIMNPEAPVHRIDRASGLKVYKAKALKVGEGGGTPLCPFDCACCF